MSMFRRGVFALLLLTVPFQTALGAAGILCAAEDLDAWRSAPATHIHDAAAFMGQHVADATLAGHDTAMEADAHDHHDAAGKCKFRSASCCSAAVLTASPLALLPPDSPLRVSPTVDRDLVSRSGDDHFRPPRATTL
jgi:hypothetical protein